MHKADKTPRTGLLGTFHQLPKTSRCAETPQPALKVSQTISSLIISSQTALDLSGSKYLCFCREAMLMLCARNKVTTLKQFSNSLTVAAFTQNV